MAVVGYAMQLETRIQPEVRVVAHTVIRAHIDRGRQFNLFNAQDWWFLFSEIFRLPMYGPL